jgi:hypothetical protein
MKSHKRPQGDNEQVAMSFEIIKLEFSLSIEYKLNLGKFKHKTKERALLAQEAHTPSKSHHELNI